MPNYTQSQQEAAQEILSRKGARESLLGFTAYTMPEFQAGDHHKTIADELDAVERGEVNRLMIFAPPRHTKSELASRRFPARYLGRHPTHQLIFATYAQDLALDFGRDVRGIVQSEEYKNLYPDVSLASDSKAANRWNTNHGGISVYVGVGGPITGRGAHIALIDDPFKNRDEADSEVVREKVWKWYSSTLRTRLMPGAAIVLILTRWHEDDLAGRLLEEQGKVEDGGLWRVVELPAIENEGTDNEKALWPEWYPLNELHGLKKELIPRDWSALYQQKPQPDEGTFFKREWFRWYDPASPPQHVNKYLPSDFAVTEGAGDWTELGVFGISPNDDLYVVDWWSGQETADKWIDAAIDLIRIHKPHSFFGESGPIRRSIEPFFLKRMRERQEYCRIEWLARTRDKATSARGFQARAAQGKVYLPKNEIGEALLDELLRFPTGKLDNKVDVCALMGMALDQAHPAIIQTEEKTKPADRWDKAFQGEGGDSWKIM